MKHEYVGPLEPAATPHSTPVGEYPDWRVDEIARKYAGPDEWDAELDSDGEIDGVELEWAGAEELL